jgi:predicted ATPase
MLREEGPTADIPLPDWIQRARYSLTKDEYAEIAVAVALELTSHLCAVVGANANAHVSSYNGSANGKAYGSSHSDQHFLSPLVKINDITAENVVVSVAHDATDVLGANLLPTRVHINLEHSNLTDAFDDRPLTQREVCFALGRILLEIFSQGDSFLMHLIDNESVDGDNNDDNDLFSGFLFGGLDIDNESKTSHQASKKSTTSAISATKFAQAKVFLVERGLPLSICRIVSDLLQAEESNRFVSKTALLSLEDAQFDLLQMRTHPARFYRDNTSPQMALEHTSLFGRSNGKLHGREEETNILIERAARVFLHTQPPSGISADGGPQEIQQVDDFLCEVVFLSGYSGSGKTSILNQLTSFFDANDWFVLRCAFDRQVAPLSMLLQSVDTFLSRFVSQGAKEMEPKIQYAFDRISRCIISFIDKEGFGQLCDLLPNFCRIFPMSFNYVHGRSTRNGTIDDPSFEITDPSSTSHLSSVCVGSGSNRLKYLLRLILKAICSGGYPVSYIFDDLQWSDSISMEVIRDIIQSDGYRTTFSSKEDLSNGGLLVLGSFRTNELDEEILINQLKTTGQTSNNVNISTIYVGELPEQEINKMLSYKFCLPMRYTRGLGQIVHQKSRGNPIYIIEFLRSIINTNTMSYSVKDRRWIWDEITIDLQMISEGVVELLTRKLRQLPHDLIETLKVVACIGQINVATIKLLDLGQFVPDMLEALESATKEGIVDRAGPVFAFTHDLLQESTLGLIPEYERKELHKQIGRSLVQAPDVANNSELCTLAVDQINMCKDMDGMLNPVERALFAQLNLAAGKHSIAAASYERARGYFEAGISLLHSNPWGEQYSLCLELFEMSAIVSCMEGNVETVEARLDSILSNARTFDDTLNSRALRTKFLASQGLYVEATEEVFGVLSNLGEEFPGEISSSHLKSEINATQILLKDTSKHAILNLPPMTDMRMLNTMKFMVRCEE